MNVPNTASPKINHPRIPNINKVIGEVEDSVCHTPIQNSLLTGLDMFLSCLVFSLVDHRSIISSSLKLTSSSSSSSSSSWTVIIFRAVSRRSRPIFPEVITTSFDVSLTVAV